MLDCRNVHFVSALCTQHAMPWRLARLLVVAVFTGRSSLVFFPENMEKSAFFRLSGKSRLLAALKRHKLCGAFLVECGAHTHTDTRK